MAKLGNLEYPELTFTQALETIEAIKREKIKTAVGLAKYWGHKTEKSGAFFVKASAMNKYYGLIDQKKSDIVLSSLAHRIVNHLSPQDKDKACRESILKVEMFRELYDKLGSDFGPNDFRPKLMDITDAPHDEFAKRAPQIERAYRDALTYLHGSRQFGREEQTPNGESSQSEGVGASGGDEWTPTPPSGVDPSKILKMESGDGSSLVRINKDDKDFIQILKVVLKSISPDEK